MNSMTMCRCATLETIDVRFLAQEIRNALILGNTVRLMPGQAFLFVSDRDPKPFFYQLKNGFPGIFRWDYLGQGPDIWQICITRIGT